MTVSDLKILPRGIRNNNPGNIRKGAVAWQGAAAAQRDLEFVEFQHPLYGLRALMRVLLTYYSRHGLDTVQSVINRWAPPHENATDNYAHAVAKSLGVDRFSSLKLSDRRILIRLAQAITLYENGTPPNGLGWYEESLYIKAADLALTP